VAAVGDILRRFRFHGVPGAPAPAGVPFDHAAQIEAELVPVFSALEAAQRRADALAEEAQTDARRRRAVAAENAHRILVEARAQADAARAESAALRLAHAESQKRALAESARAEADRVTTSAAERTPDLVEEVVRRVLVMGETANESAAGPMPQAKP